jgi:hypothetical protein
METTADKITVLARPISQTASCPCCAQVSRSIHSRYQRSLAGLPSAGRAVQIKMKVRRFRCGQTNCSRRVFAERLDPAVTTAFARRTGRLERIVHHLGLAFGGRPGQSFARRLVIPVSKDPCCGWSGAAAPRRPASPRWLASMTGLGSGAIVMGQSSAIWNNGGSSTSSLIGRRQLLPSGLPSTPPSPSSPATAGLGLYRRPPRADVKPCRSAAISRILLCSGRVAYDLQAERDRRGASGSGHSYALRNCIHYPQSPSLISSLAP